MSKTINALVISTVAAVALSVTPAAGAANKGQAGSSPASATALDQAEAMHLIFMRGEEKLARDVYLTFAQWYPDQAVFRNISESEQRHADIMREKLAQFGIADPEPDTDSLPASIGVFTGTDYGMSFTQGYKELTTQGAQSELAALYVGALIEELDMHDIVKCPSVIVDMNAGMDENSCGMEYTDEPALIKSYNSLLEGSKNHLRAFVSRIEAVIGEGNYQAQYLTQGEVNAILGR